MFWEGDILADSFYEILGAKLRAFRKMRKMTIGEIAQEINKSIATVSKYEKGEIAIDIETLFVWCNFMEVDIASLLPKTSTESVNGQITRYQEHLVKRLYVYNYRSKKRNICSAVIECDNHMCKATMYLFVENIKKYLENQMYEGINTLKNLNENYTMEWDKEYKEVSIYYEDSAKDKLGIIELQLRIRLCSMIKQTLDGNSDWRLTIQYYDCNTKELLSAEVVR